MSQSAARREQMLAREQIANRKKHWVRAVTACNSKCLFCLDSDTPRNLYLPEEQVKAELRRGREELDADKVIISGGEASLHPQFFEFIRYARSIGYERVQTVTNGFRLGEKDFYRDAVAAGLGEITWSLHGHTEALHDYLTQTPGCFRRISRGIARSARDPRVIANVDVVINKQNVAVIDKIMEYAIRLGITEFDLLHVIPQANAFEHRDELFYDVREHLPTLQKVFRLNRHPGFVIWTNRFPVSFLEGLEDLIQDPHKMLDEVNGRRFQVRRYLDEGTPLDCRQPERCVHCFIEPFCTTTDELVRRQNAADWSIWWVGSDWRAPDPADHPPPRGWRGRLDRLTALPAGCTSVGLALEGFDDLAHIGPLPSAETPLYLTLSGPAQPIPAELPTGSTLVAQRADQLDLWLGDGTALPDRLQLLVELNQNTGAWLAAHRDALIALLSARPDALQLHQPSHEHMAQASQADVRDPARLFLSLDLPAPLALRVSGLAACQAPGSRLVDGPGLLDSALFDPATGRPAVRPLARFHIAQRYRGKSVRCADCRVSDRCFGLPINMIRDQGLKLARPLVDGAWPEEAERQLRARFPEPPPRLLRAAPPEPLAASLPGYPAPVAAPVDPLAIVARDKLAARARRRAQARARRDENSEENSALVTLDEAP